MFQELQIFAVICIYWCAGVVLLVFVTMILELLPYMILLSGTIIIIIIITLYIIVRSTKFISLLI